MKKIGITFAPDDLLLPHQDNMLHEAKKHCDYLIACVKVELDETLPDNGIDELYNQYNTLKAARVVDKVLLWHWRREIPMLMDIQKPHVRFVCEQKRAHGFWGDSYCMANKIEIVYLNREEKSLFP